MVPRASSCLSKGCRYALRWAVVAPSKISREMGRAEGWIKKSNGREKGSKLLNAQCFSYHTGYKGSQAAQWELCSSPELVWWQAQSPEVQFPEWWAEEGPVEQTGLLGVCRNCNLLESNEIISMTIGLSQMVYYVQVKKPQCWCPWIQHRI